MDAVENEVLREAIESESPLFFPTRAQFFGSGGRGRGGGGGGGRSWSETDSMSEDRLCSLSDLEEDDEEMVLSAASFYDR